VDPSLKSHIQASSRDIRRLLKYPAANSILPRMFTSPFCQDVAFSVIHVSQAEDCRLLPEEEPLLSPKASAKRARELKMGRTAARQALQTLGAGAPIALPAAADRRPLWPEGFLGSITHCGDYAMAAAAHRGTAAGLGIDLETVRREMKYDISRHICDSAEIEWINSIPADYICRSIVLFSAKEALFKALYPICERYFSFRDAELLPLEAGQALRARLLVDLGGDLPRGSCFKVGYQLRESYIFSYTELERTD
jgi:enterobactin synthetase component D